MKVLVLGFGVHASGADAAQYYKGCGHSVTLIDSVPKEKAPSLYERVEKTGVEIINGEITEKDIKSYDIVVKQLSVPVHQSTLKAAKEVTNDLAALLNDERVKKMKKILVVGSNKKTSIAASVFHALNEMGAKSLLCGSIGMSGFNILQDLNEKGSSSYTHLVIEIAAWQIRDTAIALYNAWPELDIVLLTKKANEKKENYRIFGPWVKKAIVPKSSKDSFLNNIKARPEKIIYTPTSFNPYRIKEPLESAYEILKALGYHKKAIVKALSTYKGIPNRMEEIALKDNILYINDSAASIPEAVAFTLQTIGQASVHLISGGSDKNKDIDISGMKTPFKMATSITLLSGTFTDKLVTYLEKANIPYMGPFEDMRDAVLAAKVKADEMVRRNNNTQIILLAPGSGSQDYFDNEFDRGDKFKAIVKEITGKK